jgi:hypothetical protein
MFAIAVARRRILGARSIACGCFGGHAERSAPVLLARIGVLAALAAFASTATGGRLLLQPPGLPGPAEILPAALALGSGLAVVALWSQGTRWLGARS